MKINISIEGASAAVLVALADALDGKVTITVPDPRVENSTPAADAPVKRGPGRPRKDQSAAPAVKDETPYKEDAEPEAAPIETVAEKSAAPEKAKLSLLETITLYAKTFGVIPAKAYLTSLGVKMATEIPESQVPEVIDAMMAAVEMGAPLA